MHLTTLYITSGICCFELLLNCIAVQMLQKVFLNGVAKREINKTLSCFCNTVL